MAEVTDAQRPNARKVREGLVVSNGMDKTAVVDRRRPRSATPSTTRPCSARRKPVRPRRGRTTSTWATGCASPRPVRCRRRSAGASSRSWSVPDDPAGDPPPGRRQLRRPRGPVHQGARRLQAPLRRHRRRVRRHRQRRHPRRRGQEGRRRQVRRRPHQEGAPPSRRLLHPLRRERRRADQRRPAAPRHPHLRPGWPRAARQAFMRIVSLAPEVL